MRCFLFSALLLSLCNLGLMPKLYADANSDADAKCVNCHKQELDSYKSGHHAKSWSTDKSKEQFNCSTCHGPGETHNAQAKPTAATIISFSKKSAQSIKEQNARCLKCHESTNKLANWSFSLHKKNDLACSTCHPLMHAKAGAAKPEMKTCLECHKDIKADLSKMSHHPMIEGKVTCVDCHNPHGTITKHNLKADSNNQLCYKCHGDKRGPYMWAHPPVEENCLTCHKSHGSRYPKLLAEKTVSLCQNCHSDTRHPGTAYPGNVGFDNGPTKISSRLVGRQCLNCHNNIHGSNTPADPSGSYHSGKTFMR
ncbi:MAG: DmsE family decaheme c-type cytochrome [Oligoflexia bacterium]|nr:DmsE family decaheme c-type cytochrome [Oligoflexia bacterium]